MFIFVMAIGRPFSGVRVVVKTGSGYSLSKIVLPFRNSSIVGLSLLSRPAAVLRRVIAIVIDSVNRMFRGWARSHVSQKIGEQMFPTVADIDASSTVVFVSRIFGYVATSLHRAPYCVFFGFTFSVFGQTFYEHVSRETTTRPSESFSESIGIDNGNFSAVTPAFPVSVWDVTNSGQSSKSLIAKVESFRHIFIMPQE